MKGMTTILITVIIGLIVLAVVGVWTATKSMELIRGANTSVQNLVDFKTEQFGSLEQIYSSTNSRLYEALRMNLSEGYDACYQPIPEFEDFFRNYDINIIVVSDENGKAGYYRIADESNNRVEAKTFPVKNSLCLMNYDTSFGSGLSGLNTDPSTHPIYRDFDFLDFNNLIITKNVKTAQRDSFTLKVPELDYVAEFNTKDIEISPGVFIDDRRTCLVIDGGVDINNYYRLPYCAQYSMEDVADMIETDIKSCLESRESNCGCTVNLPPVAGDYEISIKNTYGAMNITFKKDDDTVTRSLPLMMRINGYETVTEKVSDPDEPKVMIEELTKEVFFFPETITYSNNEIISTFEFYTEYNQDNKISVNRKLYLIKPSKNPLVSRELVFGESRYSDWEYLTIVNDLNNVVTYCS